MKQTFSFLLLFTLFSVAVLQNGLSQPAGMRGGSMGMSQTGRFYGKIVDSISGKPIDAVSVQLVSSKFDMVKKQRKDTVISGQLTRANGNFALENVPLMGDYRLKITAIGYKPLDKKISFLTPEMQKKLMEAFAGMGAAPAAGAGKDSARGKTSQAAAPNMMETLRKVFGNDMSQMAAMADKDLGNFKLTPDAKELENVTVTGTKPMMQLGIDRRIFNVDKSLAAGGSTAIDIMRQIPTVNVDIDGNVLVRNSAPTLFVDGRPTTLTLEQIPADDIQSVELITNPSAKYDASGGGAAILNIVMKKNRKGGYNGSVRAGIDSRGMPNFGGDFNLRQSKFNFFASGTFNARKSLSWSEIETLYKGNTVTPASLIRQDIENTSNGYFAFGRGGFDFFMDNRNTISVSANFVRGQFDQEDINKMRYDSFYAPPVTELGNRNTVSDRYFQNIGTTIGFKHLFSKPGHELTSDVNFNSMTNDGTSSFNTQMYNADNSLKGDPSKQITESGGSSTFYVAQLDYANPINSNLKIEGGVRAQVRDFTSRNDNLIYSYAADKFVLAPSLSSDYDFTDRVFAAYGSVTGKMGKEGRLGYNLGLRAESSNYDGTLVQTGEKFDVDFPLSLFPSAFFSYKLTDRSDLQMNYTRRINRPNFFQLIPFIDFTDPLNLSVGNPNLSPEFTNSIEANYSRQLNNNHSILASAYFKYTDNLLTRYQYKDINPVSRDSAIYNTWVNANSSTRYGLELTSTNKWSKRFDVVTNVNIYNANINSQNIDQNLDNSQTSFYGKMTVTYKLGKTNAWTVQANGDYQSKTVLPVGGGGGMMRGPMSGNQAAGSNGYVNPNYGMDLSIRRDIIKNKNGQGYQGSLTLSMNDIFRTRIYDATTSSDFFLQNISRRRDPQVARLQFSWRFGKVDTNLFRRKNMKGEMEGMSEGMNMQ